ncbi:hypothetical protein AB0G15_41000, partial [Streptosporangium sp. NPDC023825]|uniref:hypothetical protein n=1 Tax=Streptosporangium sp. NPDC023825 TaxID=3154909 RepID=UPI003441F3D1
FSSQRGTSGSSTGSGGITPEPSHAGRLGLLRPRSRRPVRRAHEQRGRRGTGGHGPARRARGAARYLGDA